MPKFRKVTIAFICIISVLILLMIGTFMSGRTKEEVSEIIVETIDEKETNPLSMPEVIADVLSEYDVTEDQVAIVYHNLQNGETYRLNEERIVNAASVSKISIATLFVDLINQGELSWDTLVPYYDSYYEAGEGNITNGVKQVSYTVKESIYNMLYHSDNTATNILAFYYKDTYGDYREALASLTGLENLPSDVYQGNYMSAEMIASILLRISEDERYSFIVQTMREAQEGFRFSKYVPEDMAVKYGSFDSYQHDVGIYYQEDTPQYILVVLTNGVAMADEMLAEMNYRIYKNYIVS